MNDLVTSIKEWRAPAGDLSLTKTQAEHLVRWMELAQKIIGDQERIILNLKATFKEDYHVENPDYSSEFYRGLRK